ncbi:MAG: glycosyltransferase family 4 protein [Planctomycetota bacterium]
MTAIAEAHLAQHDTPAAETALRVAYLVSRFPKLTETFVLYEILAMRDQGIEVELFPLRRERTKVVHAEAQQVVESARFTPLLFSWQLVWAHLYFIMTRPWIYATTLATILRANAGSPRYLAGAIVYFPKAGLLAWRMRQLGIQHLHAHFASHPAAVAYIIHRLAGIPFSFTAHGSDLHRDRHMLREKVAAARSVVTISQYNCNVIAQECGDRSLEKIRLIHCGVDTAKFDYRSAETAFARDAGPFKIVCTGTLHEVKGQTFLIKACRALQDRQLDFECHLIGDGPDRKKLQRRAGEAGLAERIVLHGRLPQDEVAKHLQSADVLVAPSVPTKCGRREGIPVVLMEAMSAGVPVVASDLSGIPELVIDGTTGLLTPPGDAASLSSALMRLYSDPALRERLARQARLKVEEEFDLCLNARQLAKCFRQGASR